MAFLCLVSGQWRSLIVDQTHLVLLDSHTKKSKKAGMCPSVQVFHLVPVLVLSRILAPDHLDRFGRSRREPESQTEDSRFKMVEGPQADQSQIQVTVKPQACL